MEYGYQLKQIEQKTKNKKQKTKTKTKNKKKIILYKVSKETPNK